MTNQKELLPCPYGQIGCNGNCVCGLPQETELLSCPFCGDAFEVLTNECDEHGAWREKQVSCKGCSVIVGFAYSEGELDSCLRQANTRFPIAEISYLKEVNHETRRALQSAQAEIARLREALRGLLNTKDWKDLYGKTDEYLKNAPIMWANAREALATGGEE